MSTAFILSAVRTPIGKFLGELSSLPAPRLGAIVVQEALKRAGVTSGEVDEVIMGNVVQAGVGQNPARQAAIFAGLPTTIAAYTVNKVCGSGLKAVMLAAQAIAQVHVDVRPRAVRRQRCAVGAVELEAQDVFGFDAAADDADFKHGSSRIGRRSARRRASP